MTIDLDIFYPCLAVLAEMAHMSSIQPLHSAICHRIVNSPNPGSTPYPFPDGDAANLVLLGDPLDTHVQDLRQWWPTGITDKVRHKLFRRIVRQGYVLPNVTAIAFALLSTIYTTAPDSQSTRIRLQTGTKLIADFGIVKGSARVTNQDKLAYLMFDEEGEMVFEKGQDPNDHYWLYFTTISGEDVFLDCAMFTFNMCLLVASRPYINDVPCPDYVPAVYMNKEMSHTVPGKLHIERQRFSFLRHTGIHDAATHPAFGEEQLISVATYMQQIAGGAMEPLWLKMLYAFIQQNVQHLNNILVTKSWKTWPKTPSLGIEQDPGETTDAPNDDDMLDMMRKWNRKVRKGKMTHEQVGDAFNKWKAKHGIPD